MFLGFIGDTKDPYISLLVPVCLSVYVAYPFTRTQFRSDCYETWHTLYHVGTKTINLKGFGNSVGLKYALEDLSKRVPNPRFITPN